jgi:hypothetical protein
MRTRTRGKDDDTSETTRCLPSTARRRIRGRSQGRYHESLVIGKTRDTVNSIDPYVELLHQDAEIVDGDSGQVYHNRLRQGHDVRNVGFGRSCFVYFLYAL